MSEELLREKISLAYKYLREAQEIADENSLSFYFSVMEGRGATYYGAPKDFWDENGWVSSSRGC